MQEFNLAELEIRQRYNLIKSSIAPRPIAFVSSLSAAGQGNLAPFSFSMIGGANPPSTVICPVNDRHGRRKDTVLNIEETGEYVINVVTRAMADKMNQASWTYPRGVDEFDQAGFTRAPSRLVKPPRVAESPISFECRLHQVICHGEGPLASNYVLGEMLYMHASEDVLTDGHPDNTKLDLIARLGDSWYCTVVNSLFALPRPEGPS
jgi:flavin reductase (DIM6/NTAB) family NADH-FMN oxidoreductase RutF